MLVGRRAANKAGGRDRGGRDREQIPLLLMSCTAQADGLWAVVRPKIKEVGCAVVVARVGVTRAG